MDIGSGPFTMPLMLGRAFATCSTAAKCTSGRINGVFRSSDISAILDLKIAQLLQPILTRDCPGPDASSCAAGSEGNTIQQIFDTDDNLLITAAEVRGNSLTQVLFAPDVDAFKASGAPGTDGVKDSVSFGFGFGAVKARIVH
jgi:hypothetical protein